MSDLYLDLQNYTRVVDFLVATIPFAPKVEQTKAEKLVRSYEDGEELPKGSLADAADRIGKTSWPARYALKRFFAEEGREVEWKRLLEAVRPSTSYLLKRLKGSMDDTTTIDEALAASDADLALGEEERYEIQHVRSHLHEAYWREHGKTLMVLVKEGEALANGYEHRLGKLRDLATALPESLQRELFSKVDRYEDRIWFEGEILPLEILDKELEYYVEQKEISPMG